MALKLTICFSNKVVYTFIAFFTIIILGIVVYAYNSQILNPGHGADTIWVSVNGTEKTLQQALDNGDFDKGKSNIAISKGELICTGIRCGSITMPAFDDGTNAKYSQCLWTINPITSPKIFIGVSHDELGRYQRLHYTVAEINDTSLEIYAGSSDTSGNSNCPSAFVFQPWTGEEGKMKCWTSGEHKIHYMIVCKK